MGRARPGGTGGAGARAGGRGGARAAGGGRRGDWSPEAQLLRRFRPGDGGDVALLREGAVAKNASYWLCQALGSGYYWALELCRRTIAGDRMTAIYASQVRMSVRAIDQGDASAAYTGTWTTVADAEAFGGGYARTSTTGDKVTWTTPASTTRVGLLYYRITNAGICKVSIDGDATRATLLQTAQEWVDARPVGTERDDAALMLVANGGTLNPTDRVLDQYFTPSYRNTSALFADDLTAGVHTVVVTCTGYKRAASIDVRLYVNGLLYGTATTTLGGTDSFLALATDLYTPPVNASVYDHALTILPTGATTVQFIGADHGYEGYRADPDTIYRVDGVAVVPDDGQLLVGSVVQATRQTYLRHPDTGGTNIATIDSTFTLEPAWGLRKRQTYAWLVAGTARTSYVAMYPTAPTFLRGSVVGAGQDYDLSPTTSTILGDRRSRMAYTWDEAGDYGATLYVPDPRATVLDWAYGNGGGMALQTLRADGLQTKMYLRIADSATPLPIAAGDVWATDAIYALQRFAEGADAALAH